MLFLRITGKLLLVVAFLAVAFDGARMLASPGRGLAFTSLRQHLTSYAPETSAAIESKLQAGTGYALAFVAELALNLPLTLFAGVLGAMLFLLGYKRPPPEITGD
jgi:hypothetical protein